MSLISRAMHRYQTNGVRGLIDATRAFVARNSIGIPAKVATDTAPIVEEDYYISDKGFLGLDKIIPPEISDDDFQLNLVRLASNPAVKTILEIGASSGEGSTAGFARGMLANPSHPQLYALEFSKQRYAKLTARYAHRRDIHCYNYSSVAAHDWLTDDQVRDFVRSKAGILPHFYPGREIEFLNWLEESRSYANENNIGVDGISRIKSENKIEVFDLVLIDGGPFTGRSEFELVYGAKFIALDDILDIKNFDNHDCLVNDQDYKPIVVNLTLRNGFSIFERISGA